MLLNIRSYQSFTRMMAFVVGMASILPFVEHACEMINEGEAHHKKCCCERAREETPDAMHHEHLHESSHEGHSQQTSHHAYHGEEVNNHHQHGEHHNAEDALEPIPCEHDDGQNQLEDACCSWLASTFEGDAIRAVKLVFQIDQINASLKPILVDVVDKPNLTRHRPPPLISPTLSSLPSKQILFSSFLI